MNTKGLLLATHVSLADVKDIVACWSGQWVGETTSDEGHGFIFPLERDPARIYIYCSEDILLDFNEEDLPGVYALLNTSALTLIDIGISRDKGSWELAIDFGNTLIARSGGMWGAKIQERLQAQENPVE